MNGYYEANDALSFSYRKSPQYIYTNEKYNKISDGAKLLYTALINRLSMSLKNNWHDDEGRCYVYYSLVDVMNDFGWGRGKAVRVFAELDKKTGVGLIDRKRIGLGKPSVIYLPKIESDTYSVGESADKNETDVTFEPEESDVKTESVKDLNTDFMKFENETSKSIETESSKFPKQDSNNNNINKKDLNNKYFNNINHSVCNEGPDISEYYFQKMYYESVIKENIGYDQKRLRIPLTRIDEIIRIMVGAMCSSEIFVKIGNMIVPREELRQRFLEIEDVHIENVYREYCKINTPIKNISGYLITALYNAFDTAGLRVDNDEAFIE